MKHKLLWKVGNNMLQKCEGIVIRTSDYGESNKIVTLYTREFGKLGVMARGAKKTNSRLSAVSQIFTYGYFLVQTGTGLGTMQQGEMISSMRLIREDIFKTGYASYVVELLDKGTDEKIRNPFLFELLNQTLNYINDDNDIDIITNIFEMKMLNVIGLYPVLNECAICGSKDGRFAFSIRENGLICHRCYEKDKYHLPASQAAIKLLRLFYYFDLSRLGTISVKDDTKKELRKMISMYYDEYSGLHLKSKKFLDQIDKFRKML